MKDKHKYTLKINWTGNLGVGTKDYAAYSRNYTISAKNKIDILASSDTIFRGDDNRHNPEELFLASISSCHMLWYLHLCSDAGIRVTEYTDEPIGILSLNTNNGCFTSVTLNPVITITNINQTDLAETLHTEANKKCFIANSCNFTIHHFPTIKIKN